MDLWDLEGVTPKSRTLHVELNLNLIGARAARAPPVDARAQVDVKRPKSFFQLQRPSQSNAKSSSRLSLESLAKEGSLCRAWSTLPIYTVSLDLYRAAGERRFALTPTP